MTDTMHQDAVEAAARVLHERGEEALPARTRLPWAHVSAPVRSARLADARAAIAAYLAHLWGPIETAPRDGTEVLLWCVHANARFETPQKALAEGYMGPVIAHWINHNGGGWTWHGMAGEFTHWMPLPIPPALDAAAGGGDE